MNERVGEFLINVCTHPFEDTDVLDVGVAWVDALQVLQFSKGDTRLSLQSPKSHATSVTQVTQVTRHTRVTTKPSHTVVVHRRFADKWCSHHPHR